MRLRQHTSYTEILPAAWNTLAGTDNPTLRHEYLLALETSGSATAATGWQPLPLLVEDNTGRTIGAAPLWLKSHSFGELVYDFAWAQAYERAGLRYYPKLIAAIPFSPIAGPRLLVAPDADRNSVFEALTRGARNLAEQTKASSLHWLFTDAADTAALEQQGYLHRTGFQFHWHNQNYTHFDDFLASFSADKRKKLKRERRYVQEAGISMEVRAGLDVTSELWDLFYDFYTGNIQRHGGMIHLTRDFFQMLGRSLPEALVLVLARRGAEYVGAAINLLTKCIYGRYWGGREASTVCTSRPATTHRSNTASRRVSNASRAVPAANTSSRAAFCPSPRIHCTGCATRSSRARWRTFWNASAMVSRFIWMNSTSMRRSKRRNNILATDERR
jgi:predicted N-acyltransferase